LRRTASTLACLTVIAAGGIAFASPASASGYGCSGSEIDTYTVELNQSSPTPGRDISKIHLFYDSSTKKNCAANVKTTAGGSGTSTYMQVNIYRCASHVKSGQRCDDIEADDTDNGYFKQYAGPVSIKAAGRCISVFAETFIPNGEHDSLDTYAVHCG
jgi:hypothetical protein